MTVQAGQAVEVVSPDQKRLRGIVCSLENVPSVNGGGRGVIGLFDEMNSDTTVVLRGAPVRILPKSTIGVKSIDALIRSVLKKCFSDSFVLAVLS